MRLELKIHNESRALPSVEGFVRGTLQQFALADREIPRLECLVLHAVQHAVDHAYPAGELGVIELTLCEAEGRAEVTVRDYGLPEDVRRLEAQFAKPSAAGIADHEAAELVDEMHWVSFGPQGKSLQLIKWLHTQAVTDASAETELVSVAEDAPVAAEQEYLYRRMNREDALQVSQLIYRTYGGTYFNEDVYYPDRIAAANQENRVLSVVAVAQNGEVAGHCALERNQPGPVAEVGQAVVDPRHRGRGLLNEMKSALEGEARALGLIGWFADSVAIHTYTQQSNAHHGGHVCGVGLAVSPKNEFFRGIAKELSQRVSCIVYFHWLESPAPRRLYVPVHHQKMVSAIYANLGCPITLLDAADHFSQESDAIAPERATGTVDDSSETGVTGGLSIKVSPRAKLATIRVTELTDHRLQQIRHAVRELVERSRMEVVVVELPLESPLTPDVCTGLEEAGLGFSGVGPCFASRGDVLQMTYLVEPLKREPIKTYEAFADQLVEYVLDEQNRVRQQA